MLELVTQKQLVRLYDGLIEMATKYLDQLNVVGAGIVTLK